MIERRRCCSLGTRPVVGSGVMSAMLKIPNCMVVSFSDGAWQAGHEDSSRLNWMGVGGKGRGAVREAPAGGAAGMDPASVAAGVRGAAGRGRGQGAKRDESDMKDAPGSLHVGQNPSRGHALPSPGGTGAEGGPTCTWHP